ncbi:diacylglycerol kinase [Alteromonas sp. KUL49]|uniref:diacylglycerol kinase n=1 Tax=Alteromonas sp. KUL49 TaxID=2480798 RepID=UPI00102EFCFA|nr:diacylglycerol kinase [Alteromonas sp. KUL49]TAP40128.1 diacylglycerol kinase [Alteromonas sp. KUL49]GEA11241.1 diacylglycerol kinase [Alteromonas sp. KUL49]
MEKHTGLKRIVYASWYSLKGIKAAFESEAAVRQEFLAIIVLSPIALLSDTTVVEKLLLFITLFLVLIVELLNTAVETVVDRVSFDMHELSGKAKDIGSAAVFVSIFLAIATWTSILLL